jgi:hypothetical protein
VGLLEGELSHGLNDRLLARKIVVEVARTDTRFGADVGDACPSKPSPLKAASGSLQDAAAFVFEFGRIDFAQGPLLS